MSKVWRFVREWWWVFVAAAAVVAFVAWRIVRNPSDGKAEPPPPQFLEAAKRQVDLVRLEGEVRKARVVATADAGREEIDRIEALGEEEPREARRQMADWLSRNL